MFLLNLKRYLKSPVFLIGTLCYLVLLYVLQPVHNISGIDDISNSTLTTQPFSFLFFLFMSYEFFYQTGKQKLNEIIYTSRFSMVREKCYGLLIFIGLDAVLYIVFLALSVWGTSVVLGYFNYNWFILLAKAFFLYHFLLYLFAILIGLCVSFIESRIKAFAALTLIFALFSKILMPVIMSCVQGSERWTHIFDIFSIMNRSYYLTVDLFYNYSAEEVNLQRMLFWIFLAFSILGMYLNKGKKHIVTGCLFLVTGTLFCLYVQPAGYRYTGGNDWDAYMEEQQYYTLLYHNNQTGIGRKYKDADFKVTKYAGTLRAKRVLEADITVSAGQPDSGEYRFTLYHGYRIKKVTDENGNELCFEQDGDHVLVKSDTKQSIESLHFEYSGYSRKYMATSQAVFLGGNFPYLPQPGWNLYMSEIIDNNWNIYHNLKGLGYKVCYDLHFDAGQTVYSNLKDNGDGHFTGTTEGATFAASPFIKQIRLKNNCILYYSELSKSCFPDRIDETKKEFENAFDSLPTTLKNVKIFDCSVGDGDMIYYFACDHIIGHAHEIASFYPSYLEHGITPNFA